MTRASISSLVGTTKGRSLLWIHICLLFWVTLSWIGTLLWICNGAFKLRAANLEDAAKRIAAESNESHHDRDNVYYEHPHPPYGFKDIPSRSRDAPTRGLRLRTIMVSNIPNSLRNEKDLQEYFEYYMSRKVEKPSMGLTSSTQPGFLNKSFAFLFNRAKRLPAHLPPLVRHERGHSDEGEESNKEEKRKESRRTLDTPVVERVVVARKMTELASLLVRREEILVLLETAHIKLANKALAAVKSAMERKTAHKPIAQATSKSSVVAQKRRSLAADAERGEPQEGTMDEEERMEQLIDVLGPYVDEFGMQRSLSIRSKKAVSRTSRQAFRKLRTQPSASEDSDNSDSPVNDYPPSSSPTKSHPHSAESDSDKTVWDALLSLPRTSLDAYQPLVNLSHLFRGKVVPSIDYYTAKLNLLTSLITENRARAVTDYDPVSTAFVTFADPADAKRACKYLAVHPNNPLACLVTMAPAYQDIDWIRVMKSSYKGEVWHSGITVFQGIYRRIFYFFQVRQRLGCQYWCLVSISRIMILFFIPIRDENRAFTLFWLFPVSLLVGLVSIQNISLFWPSLVSLPWNGSPLF